MLPPPQDCTVLLALLSSAGGREQRRERETEKKRKVSSLYFGGRVALFVTGEVGNGAEKNATDEREYYEASPI